MNHIKSIRRPHSGNLTSTHLWSPSPSPLTLNSTTTLISLELETGAVTHPQSALLTQGVQFSTLTQPLSAEQYIRSDLESGLHMYIFVQIVTGKHKLILDHMEIPKQNLAILHNATTQGSGLMTRMIYRFACSGRCGLTYHCPPRWPSVDHSPSSGSTPKLLLLQPSLIS
ncbi:hypothetical protein BDN72DRAFT_847088 [Pluteus cervinus]|uniref:Uncharacterized protein n=1 Tax=Pluteus cervinus TaxID=181527 RepID=A0ACD3AE35_9AGAR|nr:hypothetical protein BDN72DRAFT_847088 [Pluteus cervinus]